MAARLGFSMDTEEMRELTLPMTSEVQKPRCCGWKLKACCGGFLVVLCVLAVVVGVEIHQRSEPLEPLLRLLETVPACHDPNRATCIVDFNSFNVTKFDLRPPQPEKALLGFMWIQVARRDVNVMREILCGAHLVLLRDRLQRLHGNLSSYDLLRNWPGAYKRMSSHRSDREQYGIPQGQILHTILLGDLGGHTWFQFEGNGVDGVLSFIMHMCNYFEYKITGRNIGPLGTSKYTDQSPLLINRPVDMNQQECPVECKRRSLVSADFTGFASVDAARSLESANSSDVGSGAGSRRLRFLHSQLVV
ncbi:unnamed protein product [Effrenium voratum]|nr:unnamed protein product [Effrenium voratum]